jgi:hypothetical protein
VNRDVEVWSDVRAVPALAMLAGLDCVAGLVLLRNFGGGPPLHLTNARLSFAGLAVAALTVAGRWWLLRIERERAALWVRTLLMALCVLPMLVLLSLATNRHSPWAVSLVSALAVASGGTVLLWNRVSSASVTATRSPVIVARALPLEATPAKPQLAETNQTPAKMPKAEGRGHKRAADEWMERTTGEAGQVRLQGQIVAEFSAGQSIATVHIPFCPAFCDLPEFSYEIVDSPSIRARTPAVYRYGARLELKRSGDITGPDRAEIRFSATDACNSARAA